MGATPSYNEIVLYPDAWYIVGAAVYWKENVYPCSMQNAYAGEQYGVCLGVALIDWYTYPPGGGDGFGYFFSNPVWNESCQCISLIQGPFSTYDIAEAAAYAQGLPLWNTVLPP